MRQINISHDAFVMANHRLLTIPDMVMELGTSRDTIVFICSRLNITPITIKERNENFISDHLNWSLEKLGKTLNIAPGHIRNLLKTYNLLDKYNSIQPKIQLPEPIKASPNITIPEPSFDSGISAELKEYIRDRATLADQQNRPSIERIKDKYNQTGTDYTDYLYGIQTTKRETISAFKAKIK